MSGLEPSRRQLLLGAGVLGAGALAWRFGLPFGAPARAADGAFHLTDQQWHARLSPAQYDVLRQEGTEMPFSSRLDMVWDKGTYACAGCDQAAYSSDTKFDSHTGWPSFWRPLPAAVVERHDGSLGLERTEIHCSRCASHLGHVFNDGPAPTGLRYCMNGVALNFTPATKGA